MLHGHDNAKWTRHRTREKFLCVRHVLDTTRLNDKSVRAT